MPCEGHGSSLSAIYSFRLSGSRTPNLERIIPAAMVKASLPIHFRVSPFDSGGMKLFVVLNMIGSLL